MSFTPASSIMPATVTVGGTVAVSNFPASQAVTGPLTDAQLRASAVPVSGTVAVSGVAGTVAVDGSAHTQPVSGPLTNAELRAADVIVDQGAGGTAWAVVQATVPWLVDASGFTVPVAVTGQPILVDGSAVTQPVSAASLPLPDGAATEDTMAAVNGGVQDVALTAILARDRIPA